jgi:outer membrane scaffolding protein for murein synthesis (MipA/OmpV family)
LKAFLHLLVIVLWCNLHWGYAWATQEDVCEDSRCESCVDDCVEVGSWQFSLGLGAGVRSNPLYQMDDTPWILLPEVSYYGERFFLRNLEMGFTLGENAHHQFNLLLAPSYDQMYFNRWDPLNFTDSHPSIGTASSGVQSTQNYRVNITENLAVDGDDKKLPTRPTLIENIPVAFSAQAENIRINQMTVPLVAGEYRYTGNSGNPIWVQIKENIISISGVEIGDEIQLGNALVDNSTVPSGIENTGTTDSRNLNITVNNGNTFLVNETSAPPTQGKKVSAESVAQRKTAALAGLEYAYTLNFMSLYVQLLNDISGVHKGSELRFAAVFPWQWGQQQWAFSLGTNYKSQKVLDYYYGLHPQDAVDETLLFSPKKSGFESMTRLDWQRPISAHWSLRGTLQLKYLPAVIQQSALVDERLVGSIFIGGIYHF